MTRGPAAAGFRQGDRVQLRRGLAGRRPPVPRPAPPEGALREDRRMSTDDTGSSGARRARPPRGRRDRAGRARRDRPAVTPPPPRRSPGRRWRERRPPPSTVPAASRPYPRGLRPELRGPVGRGAGDGPGPRRARCRRGRAMIAVTAALIAAALAMASREPCSCSTRPCDRRCYSRRSRVNGAVLAFRAGSVADAWRLGRRPARRRRAGRRARRRCSPWWPSARSWSCWYAVDGLRHDHDRLRRRRPDRVAPGLPFDLSRPGRRARRLRRGPRGGG